ncbi:DUF6898 family protein [Parvibaculum sp.]|uniref:DUF6898 family protein n=1 Tax=Parvibaculum sp. TaxID=2024848 RepID=UPI00391DF8DC
MPPDRAGNNPGSGGNGSGEGREVIFEYMPVGGSVKVTAVDVATGLEVSVVGPSTAAQHELERIAVRKLRYMLEKKEKEGQEPEKKTPPESSGGGIVV